MLVFVSGDTRRGALRCLRKWVDEPRLSVVHCRTRTYCAVVTRRLVTLARVVPEVRSRLQNAHGRRGGRRVRTRQCHAEPGRHLCESLRGRGALHLAASAPTILELCASSVSVRRWGCNAGGAPRRRPGGTTCSIAARGAFCPHGLGTGLFRTRIRRAGGTPTYPIRLVNIKADNANRFELSFRFFCGL